MIRTVGETGSTNDDLLALARQGAPEGTWLRAEVQTGGKGRSGRHWVSPPGNLYASTIVRAGPGDPLVPTLALVAGIALHHAASDFAGEAPLSLKWPNDLMSGASKLAGILLEGENGAIVCGFGVNLAHCPEGLDRPVTSLHALAGVSPLPEDFALRLADRFAHWLQIWRAESVRGICTHWMRRAHEAGTRLSVDVGDGNRLEGAFEGLDPATGCLRLRLADGTVRAIQAGDVFLI